MGHRNKAKAMVRDYTESLIIAVFLALLIRVFVLSAYKIPTTSMWPTLQVGDFVFAYKLPYGFRLPLGTEKYFAYSTPERGEVVVFNYSSDDSVSYIKRVVAVPGDKIEIRKRRLIINNQVAHYAELGTLDGDSSGQFAILHETLMSSSRRIVISKHSQEENFGPEIVPAGHVFVLGDNRDSSDDSRYWGMIPTANVEGRVFAIWLSLDWQKSPGGWPSVRWSRLFAGVH